MTLVANGDDKIGAKPEGTKGPVFPLATDVFRMNPNSPPFESNRGSHIGTVNFLDGKDDLLLVIGVNYLEMSRLVLVN